MILRSILAALLILVGSVLPARAEQLNDPFNFLSNVARDNYQKAARFAGYGEVTTGGAENNIDVWIADNTQPEPVPAGYQPTLISGSVEDDPDKGGAVVGTGIHTVTVHYLDTDGNAQDESIDLNGMASVTMIADDVQFINEMHAIVVGTGLVSAGNIDAKNGANITSRIGIAGNYSLSTMRMVPTGYTLYIVGWHAAARSSGGSKSAILRLRTSSNTAGTIYAGVYQFKDTTIAVEAASGWLPFYPPVKVPSGATVKVSTWTTGAMTVSASWRGWIELD